MTDAPEPDPPAGPDGGAGTDARDLRRGVTVNMVGYVIKLLHPVLLAVATQLYGAGRFGVFVVSQAAILMLARVCLFGLDKGVLWWVAQREPAEERSGVLGALAVTGAAATLVAGALLLLPGDLLGSWSDQTAAIDAVRVMGVALVPLVATEILLNATMAKRRMEPQVLIRETLVPLGLLASAVLMWWAGLEDVGLAVAFLVSNLIGLAAAAMAFGRIFRGSTWGARPAHVPRQLRRYAGPFWLSEMANTALLRTDIVVLALVTGPFVVGVYGVVVQFANAVRAIRRSFDPIVTAIVSRLSVRPDPERLAAGFSYATVLVTATQVPVFVFLAVFGAWLLPLYGDGFEAGAGALLVFCAFFGVHGAAGLAGIVVAGFGRSGLTLLNVVVALVVQAIGVWALASRWGLEGAALGVGVAYTVQHAMQLVEMRIITGRWNYTRSVVPMFAVVLGSVTLLTTTWFLLLPAGPSVARLAAFGVFVVIYGLGALHLLRTGRLSAVPPESPAGA